jgi:type IV pilus assembly protein PilA
MTKQSKKGFTLVEIMIVVVIIGLLAAMAIPAFNKVREESREKAMLNNLRQVASAGQRYILEEGKASVTYTDLVPDYLPTIQPVALEGYGSLVVKEDSTTLKVTSGDQVVTYTF